MKEAHVLRGHVSKVDTVLGSKSGVDTSGEHSFDKPTDVGVDRDSVLHAGVVLESGEENPEAREHVVKEQIIDTLIGSFVRGYIDNTRKKLEQVEVAEEKLLAWIQKMQNKHSSTSNNGWIEPPFDEEDRAEYKECIHFFAYYGDQSLENKLDDQDKRIYRDDFFCFLENIVKQNKESEHRKKLELQVRIDAVVGTANRMILDTVLTDAHDISELEETHRTLTDLFRAMRPNILIGERTNEPPWEVEEQALPPLAKQLLQHYYRYAIERKDVVSGSYDNDSGPLGQLQSSAWALRKLQCIQETKIEPEPDEYTAADQPFVTIRQAARTVLEKLDRNTSQLGVSFKRAGWKVEVSGAWVMPGQDRKAVDEQYTQLVEQFTTPSFRGRIFERRDKDGQFIAYTEAQYIDYLTQLRAEAEKLQTASQRRVSAAEARAKVAENAAKAKDAAVTRANTERDAAKNALAERDEEIAALKAQIDALQTQQSETVQQSTAANEQRDTQKAAINAVVRALEEAQQDKPLFGGEGKLRRVVADAIAALKKLGQ